MFQLLLKVLPAMRRTITLSLLLADKLTVLTLYIHQFAAVWHEPPSNHVAPPSVETTVCSEATALAP